MLKSMKTRQPIRVVKNKDFVVVLPEVKFTFDNGESATAPRATIVVKASSRLDAFTKALALHRETHSIPPQVNIFSESVLEVKHTIGEVATEVIRETFAAKDTV